MKASYWPLLLALGLAACGNDVDETPPTPELPPTSSAVKFLSTIEPVSRATETNFETNDVIGVFAVERTIDNQNGQLMSKNYADNVAYKYSGTFFTAQDKAITLPSNGAAVFYHAVYPHASNLANEFTFAVNTDQYTNRGYTESDLCTASTEATTEETPVLTFNHRLSHIVLTLNYEERPAGGEEIYLNNVKTNVSVNLNNNRFLATGTEGSVRAAKNGTDSYRVIVPPQTIKGGTTVLTLNVGGDSYPFQFEEDVTWNSGRQYEYTLNVSKQGKITFTGTINPWNTIDIEDIVPPSTIEEMEPYMSIYRGKNPPIIEGTYYVQPVEAVYCSDGYFTPGYDNIYPELIRFSNQDNKKFTLDYEDKDEAGGYSVGDGAFISGEGSNFTVYFDTQGTSSEGIWYKTALVVSGTKTSSGISGLTYAIVMVDKVDPDGHLMDVGVFRVFKDGTGLASNSTWDYFGNNVRGFTSPKDMTSWGELIRVK